METELPWLERRVTVAPTDAGAWKRLGFAYGSAQRMSEARQAFARAAMLEPSDPVIALGHARASLDAGLPASRLFQQALSLTPGNLDAVAGLAAALGAEGQTPAAEALLESTLLRHPEWLAGHRALSDLRFTKGDAGFARSYAAACAARPHHLGLRLAWFGAVAQTHDWESARLIVAQGEALLGSAPGLIAARTYLAAESGDFALAEELFAQCDAGDPVLGIAHIRHCLRTAQIDKAQALALPMLAGPSAPRVWPYLSLIWRLLGDGRAQWLGDPSYIGVFDLGVSTGELHELAACLRRLHTDRGPHLDQSVRAGTQTPADRPLFYRAEPEIQRLRAHVIEAVRAYVAALPPPIPGHPLLGMPREPILFSGSWSVRLQPQGHHVSHTHPLGWISSALYVSLPEAHRLGPAPAGWIRFGSPPPVLGLNLPAYTQIEPKPGRLVLFPSTLWHDTLPFEDGERLVVAFDVMRPVSPPD